MHLQGTYHDVAPAIEEVPAEQVEHAEEPELGW